MRQPGQPATATPAPTRLAPVITALILAMLMSSLGQMIFSTALPTIVGELGGINHMSWVITAYLLAQTLALPLWGKAGDRFGRGGLFLGAVVVFMIGAAVGGAATTMTMLVMSRVIQGVAAGGLMVLSQAITADVVPARQRGTYMGYMGAAFALASVLGPVAGGWFTDGPGWRWGLWVNIPLGVITLIGARTFLKLPQRRRQGRADIAGALTVTIATTCLVLTATWGGRDYAWTDPMIIVLITGAVVGYGAFIVAEKHAADPLIPLTLFHNRNFVLTSTTGLFTGIFLFGALAYMPTWLQMVHGLTPTRAGFMLVPMMLAMTITSITVGKLVTRSGRYKAFPLVGMLVTAAALAWMSQLSPHIALVSAGMRLALLGVGVGMAMQILVLIVQNSFPIAMVGTATAANNFIRQIGASLGSAIVGGVFSSHVAANLHASLPAAIAAAGPVGMKAAERLGHGAQFLTPATIATLPEPIHDAVVNSYSQALVPVFAYLAPLAVIAALLMAAIRHDALKEDIS